MKLRGEGNPATEQKQVDQAVSRCQAAALPLTPRRLQELVKICSVEGQKTGGFASQGRALLRSAGSMQLASLLKRCSLVGASGGPHGIEDADPDVGQGTNGHRVAFAFGSFALIILQCPRLAPGRLPGKLIERIAQRFQTGRAAMRFLVVATLVQDGSCASQRLQTAGIVIALPILSQFRQQSRGQSLTSPWKTRKDATVSVGQKKGFDILVIGGNLLDKRRQLTDQDQHQAKG